MTTPVPTSQEYVNQLLPVGRFVGGSLYEPRTEDAEGRPLVYKTGKDAGQPRVDYYVAVAIRKTPGCTHWANEVSSNPAIGAWGKTIWEAGHRAFPGGQAANPENFAWKITDGDSTKPNKKQKKPCDNEGYPGCWVLHLGRSSVPKIVSADAKSPITEPNAVKPGHFIQAHISVNGNKSLTQPGVFLNHNAIAHSGFGTEISWGPDVASMGFGGDPLPEGASATPVGITTPAAPPMPPGAGVQTPPGAVIPGTPVPPSGTPVPPNMPPAPGATVAPPAAPPAPPAVPATPNAGFVAGAINAGPTMTAAANGATYAQMIAAGWTDATLIANGMMATLAATPAAPPAPPATPAAPPAPPAPPAAPVGPTMTAAANGATYAQMIAAGWTDATLIANGMMAA